MSDQHYRRNCNLRNKYKRRTFLPSVGFEPAVSVNEWPQTYALGLMAPGIGFLHFAVYFFPLFSYL